MTDVRKNFIYNVGYQILSIILPFITVPYVSRVLGAEGVGIYSYTYSIVYYFMLFALIGINNYGNRTIAKVRDNKEQLSRKFFSIYSIQIFMSLFMIILYVIFTLIFLKEYKLISVIQIIYLISCIFDVNWFFFGLEKFKLTVIRSSFLRIISLFLIILFVNDRNDLLVYTLILSLSTLFSQLILFINLKKELNFVKIKFSDIKECIKPCIILFIPTISVSLYKVMDKIMLGSLASTIEVGYYEQAEKVISIIVCLSTALGTIMLPRISNLLSNGNLNAVKQYISKSIKFTMFMAFPLTFGIIAISNQFIPIFLGSEFTKSSILLNLLSITIPFLSFANVIRTQYLIPNEKDKHFILSVLGGAIVNIIINLLLIPRYSSVGASIGTIFAEFFVMLYQTIAVSRNLPIYKYIKDIIPFFIKGLFMLFIVSSLNYLNIVPFWNIILKIIVGALVYFILNIKYINEIFELKKILDYIKYGKDKIMNNNFFQNKKYGLLKKFYKMIGNNKKYISILFKETMGYEFDLDNPKSYNEKINWIKFNYYNSLYEKCSDKIDVREYIKQKKLEKILTKKYAIYNNVEDITLEEINKLPDKFVIKTTHSSGGVVVVKDKNEFNLESAKKILLDSFNTNLYKLHAEWQYKNLKPRIIVEELIETDKPELIDYKFFCFNGKVEYIYIAHGTTSGDKNYCIDFYDKKWTWKNVKRVGHKNYGPIEKPKKFEEMKKIAETLSKDFEHVRVDLYCENDKIYFGELTFTTGAGLGKFDPMSFDYELGEKFDISKLINNR